MDAPQLRLLISGMTCAGCVKSAAEKALSNPRREQRLGEFWHPPAQVTGSATQEALIAAVAEAGYRAELIVDIREAERTREAQGRYLPPAPQGQRAVASLAIPLMLSMFGLSPTPHGRLPRIGW